MNDNLKLGLLYSSAFICACAVGWFSHEGYNIYTNERTYDGLRFVSNNSQVEALAQASVYDKYADWVCINSKGMTFNDCVSTAQHECAHEIMAEIIEDKPELIEKVMEVISK